VFVISILLSLAMERELSGARISRRSIFPPSQIRSQRAGFHRYERLGLTQSLVLANFTQLKCVKTCGLKMED